MLNRDGKRWCPECLEGRPPREYRRDSGRGATKLCRLCRVERRKKRRERELSGLLQEVARIKTRIAEDQLEIDRETARRNERQRKEQAWEERARAAAGDAG